ncbi:hypothetical protein C2G38_2172254 [Gigaspora rosea]|uniref:Uncharacterized protein n=1 Tax=Gigaspora rosea TaxID=44941 RepID=A0A397VKQ7_9GLOM|nr:hypothetical protein C2G38_2172254 [Gigaspora rosea]
MEELKFWNYMIKWGIAQNPDLLSDGPEKWTKLYQTILKRDLWKEMLKRIANPNRKISSIILPPRITMTPKLDDQNDNDRINALLSHIIRTEDEAKNIECIYVTFHVHVPPQIEKFGKPVVVGNCKELEN